MNLQAEKRCFQLSTSVYFTLFSFLFADEKFNFERLENSTVLNRQPLLHPQPLGLSPAEELTVRDNLEIFRKNGFEFRDAADGKLLLAAVPFSKGITFGADDVWGHTAVRGGTTGGPVVRPSRVRAMLASRACRSSIMIGKALNRKTMERILEHLSGLQSPWNCPHGRPTMRHLAVLPK